VTTPKLLKPGLDRWRAFPLTAKERYRDALRAKLAAARAKQRSWLVERRPAQVLPDLTAAWFVWLILAGRGWGKTRTGAETVADWAREHPGCRIALVAITFADGRDTMVEGESGLLAVLDEAELRGGSVDKAWNRSLGELFLANGSRFKIYSSEKPRQLRGPQHHFGWGDEMASWIDAFKGAGKDTTWSNLLMGMRLPEVEGKSWPAGFAPRIIVTTTPKPVPLLRQNRTVLAREPHRAGLLQMDGTVVTTGSTSDNLSNLSEVFRRWVVDPMTGTTLGRQELNAELVEDVEGALVTHDTLNRGRRLIGEVPHLLSTVVAVDPATTANDSSDETGIVIVGTDAAGDGWVLDDRSGRMTPEQWGRTVWEAVIDHGASAIVVEDNAGGDMVETVLVTTWEQIRAERYRRGLTTPIPSIVRVHPSGNQGKWVRASALQPMLEQTRVHFVVDVRRPGVLDALEDQITTWTGDPKEDSPDRVDAMVHGLTWLLFPMQRSMKIRSRSSGLGSRSSVRR
jgi:phage terminase large subunit-like protein